MNLVLCESLTHTDLVGTSQYPSCVGFVSENYLHRELNKAPQRMFGNFTMLLSVSDTS